MAKCIQCCLVESREVLKISTANGDIFVKPGSIIDSDRELEIEKGYVVTYPDEGEVYYSQEMYSKYFLEVDTVDRVSDQVVLSTINEFKSGVVGESLFSELSFKNGFKSGYQFSSMNDNKIKFEAAHNINYEKAKQEAKRLVAFLYKTAVNGWSDNNVKS